MADADLNTLVSDVITPERFAPYIQQLTEEKSRLVQSGILARSEFLDNQLAGGGLTFKAPSWRDLDNDADNTSTDESADHFRHTLNSGSVDIVAINDSRPKATGTAQELAVRLSRNQSWGSSSLAAALAGSDPMASIGGRVSTYWSRRLQAAFIATMSGVNKDNGANDSGDYANDIAGATYQAGVTDFSAEAANDTIQTMGDSGDMLTGMLVNSVVYTRMKNNNLIDFIPDAQAAGEIPTFMGKMVIVDDGMPSGTATVRDTGAAGDAGTYETWFFAEGAAALGVGSADFPVEVQRQPQAGNGGGQNVLYSRQEWAIHPVGHAYTGTAPDGGPTNAATTNNLNIATSWNRVFSERKQIKFARLITREV